MADRDLVRINLAFNGDSAAVAGAVYPHGIAPFDEHDSEKACPGVDPRWLPIFG
jgi:hypothetical protein